MSEIKLNIGCGECIADVKDGWVNIDQYAYDPDVLKVNIEEAKLPYADSSVSLILASHVLEHINNLIPLMNECHRVLKPMGLMHIAVPKFPHLDSVKDPTHVRFFTVETFNYFSRYRLEGHFEGYEIKPWFTVYLDESDNLINTALTPAKSAKEL